MNKQLYNAIIDLLASKGDEWSIAERISKSSTPTIMPFFIDNNEYIFFYIQHREDILEYLNTTLMGVDGETYKHNMVELVYSFITDNQEPTSVFENEVVTLKNGIGTVLYYPDCPFIDFEHGPYPEIARAIVKHIIVRVAHILVS